MTDEKNENLDIKKEAIKKSQSNEIASEQKSKIAIEFERIEKEIEENSLSKEQLFEWFREEITRKDVLIAKLKKDNAVLFNTAMRSSDREFEKITSEDYDDNNHVKNKEDINNKEEK